MLGAVRALNRLECVLEALRVALNALGRCRLRRCGPTGRQHPGPRRGAHGPTPKDQQWRAEAGEGFAVHGFTLDWDHEVAICPAGHASRSWAPDLNQGRAVVRIRSSTPDRRPCRLKLRRTRAARRLLTPRRRDEAHAALGAARARGAGGAFATEYHRRAGIEGTPSAGGMRTLHRRRARYVGLAKTRLQHGLAAAAINLVRLGAWLGGQRRARARQCASARLMAQPVCA